MNNVNIKFIISFFFLFTVFVYADDPFTRSLGQPPVVENKPAPVVEQPQSPPANTQSTETAKAGETSNVENILKDMGAKPKPEENTDLTMKEKVPIPKKPEDEYVSKIINIDPVLGHALDKYVLKGVAISKKYNKERRKKVFNLNTTNRKKVDLGNIPVTHFILPNETLESIGQRYGFTKEEMAIANAMVPGRTKLVPGNRLAIPNRYHQIKEGETLNSIAEMYHLDPMQLAAFNNLKKDEQILIDQKILLPFYLHITTKEETLKEIAKTYRRTLQEVMDANKVEENKLIAMNELVKIPIHVNHENNFVNLNIKSVLDYRVNPKNLAIVEIQGAQFMVREGDSLGDKDGKIVSIKTNQMIVVEDSREFLFKINAPVVGQVASAVPTIPAVIPGQAQPGAPANPNDQTAIGAGGPQPVPTNEGNTVAPESNTNVEDLFKFR